MYIHMEVDYYMDQWCEELPDKCPPDEAFAPTNFVVYRLCRTSPPLEKDFLSQRAKWPSTVFKNISECILRSISCWNDLSKCLNAAKLPAQKGKQTLVMKLILQQSDGLVLKTLNDPNHYSWWRTKSFKINSAIII